MKKIKTDEVKCNSSENVTHEVYLVRDKIENLLYVGHGQIGRSKHCVSGKSHVKELNAMYFSGQSMRVEVIFVSNKKKCEELENYLIRKHRPLFNKRNRKSDYNKKHITDNFKSGWLEYFFETTGTIDLEKLNRDTEKFENFLVRFPLSTRGVVFECREDIECMFGVYVFREVYPDFWVISDNLLCEIHHTKVNDLIKYYIKAEKTDKRLNELINKMKQNDQQIK